MEQARLEQFSWYFKYYTQVTSDLSDRLVHFIYGHKYPFCYRDEAVKQVEKDMSIKEEWENGIPF